MSNLHKHSKIGILVLLLLASFVTATAQQHERPRAFQVFKDAKYTEALPVFEKLAAATPDDREVLETYGFLVLTQTAYLKDAAARKEARRRGREILLSAQKLGADSALLKHMLESVPA